MNLRSVFGRVGTRPDFSGKTVAIYCPSEERGGMFQDVKLVTIGFSHFLVGRRVEREETSGDRWSNVACWIAIHDISQMLVFDDIDAARRAFGPG